MDDDYDVEPLAQGQFPFIDDRTELALEPVADHRALETPARAEANARLRQPVRQDPDGQRRAASPSSPSVDGAENLAALQWRWGWRGLDDREGPA